MVPIRYFAKLDNGTDVFIRNVTPEDRTAIQTGVEMMSHRSRYQRFFSCKSKLSETQLDNLTQVDGIDHVALIAMSAHQAWKGFGIARFIRSGDKSKTAEAAIALLDDFQGKGLGSLLMDVLMALANERGIYHFTGYVLPENKRMIRILQKKGATFSIEPGPVFKTTLNISKSMTLPHNVIPVETRVKDQVA